jgi:N-acetylglucosamine-6-phosphate deacetylase
MIIRCARIVTADGIVDGTVTVEDAMITSAAAGAGPADLTWPGLLLPGFVDLHVHGGGGSSFDDGRAAIAAGLAVHRAHGTTRSLVSLVTAAVPDMVAAIGEAAGYASGDPGVLGLHLEGPFLSEARRGVHRPEALLDPDPAVLDTLLAAGAGRVRVVTVAPERPGGLDLVRRLVAAGIHAAVGHSDADYAQARAAFDAGADLVTHACNGMRPLHHRDPAILGAAMDSPGVVLEVIDDGVHLHPATVRLLRAIAPGRLALITDAMAATGAPDGAYALAGWPVQVTGGVARLADGTIAGSTLTLDRAVAQAVSVVGMEMPEAVAAASVVPARLLGVDDRYGSIAVGRAADLVFTDGDLRVAAVLADGRWVDDRRP